MISYFKSMDAKINLLKPTGYVIHQNV